MADDRYWKAGPEQGPYKDAIQQIWALAHPGTQTTYATGRPVRPTHAAVSLDTLRAEAARLLPKPAGARPAGGAPEGSAGAAFPPEGSQPAALGPAASTLTPRPGSPPLSEPADGTAGDRPDEAQVASYWDIQDPNQWLFEQAGRQIYGVFGGDPNAEQPVHAGDPINADGWEDWSRQALIGAGLPEEVADVGVLLVSASPVGTAADIAQGLTRFGDALAEGDVAGALGHLAEAGLDAVKIGKVKKALGAMTDRGMKQLAEAIDDPVSVYLMQDLYKQGLVGESVRTAIRRGAACGRWGMGLPSAQFGPVSRQDCRRP
jgi:hypothetical protein